MVSETFLHAWRRRAELPAEPLPWLLVTARHTIHNRTRGQRRAESLWRQAVSEYWRTPAPLPPDEAVAERDAMIAALAACSPAEREALLLIAWDGLTYADAAAVLGCSERALTVRVSR
ncbi:MAG TPA: sigma-70 family RNA polymerase sigma factor, partial [Tetrasphaera sp.]|nr:sigma-70 family RNA polymerase sigma factor [Tetrasphaera sp.]